MEIWRKVPELPLECNMAGEVRLGEIILSQETSRAGYKTAAFRLGPCRVTLDVHRLVCAAFNGLPRNDKLVAAHADNDKTNNGVFNLRWASQKDNIADKWIHDTMLRGEKHPLATVSAEKVRQIRARWKSLRMDCGRAPRGSVLRLLDEFGIGRRCFEHIVYGTSWKE